MSHASHAPPVKGFALRTALVLTAFVAFLELAGGIVAGSLALLADSAHVFMDAFALGIAVAASAQAGRPATGRRTFGFARLEVLAALGNGGLLLAVAVLIAVEAVRRFGAPGLPQGGTMAIVAGIGFVVNVGIGLTLRHSARDNINVRAALFHVASDALGAIAVAVGGVLVLTTRQTWIDPALSLLVAAAIAVGVLQVMREAADVLMESAPAHASVASVRASLSALEGVVDVHDLHVWTIGPGVHALAAHVLLADARISEASQILRRIDARMRREFSIGHVTVQFECERCSDDERIVCTQVPPAEG